MILDHMPRGSAVESKMEIVDITAIKESASASPNRERLMTIVLSRVQRSEIGFLHI